MRIDKWLWAVRIYKSRTQATDACKEGRVKSGELTLKPASNIQSGQTIQIRKQGIYFEYLIIELLEKRVGAPIAEKAYTNLTPQENIAKLKGIQTLSTSFYNHRPKGSGRPTKKERRQVDEIFGEIENEEN